MNWRFRISFCAVMWCALAAPLVVADTVDDFESYGNTADLQATWVAALGDPDVELVTGPVDSGNQAMRVKATYSAFPIAIVTNGFATPVDWSSASEVSIRFRGTANSDPSADVLIQLLASNGSPIASGTNVGGAAQTSWSTLSIPLAGQTNLDAVATIQLVIFPYSTSVDVYFDNLEVSIPMVSGAITATEPGGSTIVTEGITNETVSVSLSTTPSANVTVTPSFTGEINVTPNPGIITPAGWASSLVFQVTALDDDKIEGTESVNLLFSTTSGDSTYDGLATSNIVVTVNDNDFMVTPELESPVIVGPNIRFSVDTRDNQLYSIETTDDPGNPTWTIQAGPFPGFGATIDLFVPLDRTTTAVRMTSDPLP